MSRASLELGIVSGAVAGKHYSLKAIGSYQQAQVLLSQGHRYLERNGNGEARRSLRR
ncbi:hypothetical protein KBY93_13660 [Synechococcus sp. J7-Johnson]|uniref:hypothetical protein n=1 Tax=Synechococcus sp. J7-Johnson TaxID=2823737 RepID=UPI0020CEBD9E|nr:hypothetical protein [Synechococcus sp. J7-Johnson]MCP9841669.1 hypothetical protein [Synechococcus sp. J7-Johnson]